MLPKISVQPVKYDMLCLDQLRVNVLDITLKGSHIPPPVFSGLFEGLHEAILKVPEGHMLDCSSQMGAIVT